MRCATGKDVQLIDVRFMLEHTMVEFVAPQKCPLHSMQGKMD